MIYQFLTLQLIAHLLGDFIFQPHVWSLKKKRKPVTMHHIWHVLVVFIFAYLLSLDVHFWKFALFLTIVHFKTDVLKSYLQINTNLKDSLLFFLDQGIHLVVLVVISLMYSSYSGIQFLVDIPIKYLLIVAGFILCGKPSNILIKNIFDSFSISVPQPISIQREEENHDLPNAGKLIGIMERFLVFCLILVNQYSAVGLIIAAKSILRFKDNTKNEYVLVGTLLSFGIAIMLGVLVTALVKSL